MTWEADSFSYAESFDEAAARYRGLRGGQAVAVSADDSGLLVKSAVARRQLDAEVIVTPPGPKPGPRPGPEPGPDPTPPPPVVRKLRRFHGTVSLNPERVGRDAGRVAEEVIAHLAGQVGATVTVTLEIEASMPDGASEQVVRVVTENGNVMKFTSHGFEEQ